MANFNLPFGVRVSNSNPLDASRYVVADNAARDYIITEGRAYEGLQVYVANDKKLYILTTLSPANWELVGSDSSALVDLRNYIDGSLNAKANDASLDLYVLKSGDTMSGPLVISSGGLDVTGDTSLHGELHIDSHTHVGGNLTVNGSLYVIDVAAIDTSGSFIRLNTGLTGPTPAYLQSGIVVERGDGEPYIFVYDEDNETFRIGITYLETSTHYSDASTQAVATRQDAPIDLGVAFWNDSLKRFDTSTSLTVTSIRQWNEAQDASILLRLKEASLGTSFKWVSGLLDVSISSTFNPSLSDSIKVPNDVGGILADTSVGYLRGKTYDQLWVELLFPTVLAYVGTARSASLSGVTTATNEVGTAYAPSSTASYVPGLIKNGDDTNGPNLTGDAYRYEFKLPSGTIDASFNTAGNSQAHTFTSYNIAFGTNTWSVDVSYNAGTGLYYDNKGNPVNNLDSQRLASLITANSGTITGRRYAWRGYGAASSHPTDSAGVRALSSKSFLSATNTGTFDISIPSGNAEVYFYIPAGKTVVVQYVESSYADVTGSFTTSAITVNDAAGAGQSYTSYVSNFGGYPETATYRVTIS